MELAAADVATTATTELAAADKMSRLAAALDDTDGSGRECGAVTVDSRAGGDGGDSSNGRSGGDDRHGRGRSDRDSRHDQGRDNRDLGSRDGRDDGDGGDKDTENRDDRDGTVGRDVESGDSRDGRDDGVGTDEADGGGLQCLFVADQSLPDGAVVAAGARLRKTWRLTQAQSYLRHPCNIHTKYACRIHAP